MAFYFKQKGKYDLSTLTGRTFINIYIIENMKVSVTKKSRQHVYIILGAPVQTKIKGTFSLLNIFSSLHSSNTECPPSMNVFTVLHVWTIQQLSVFLETDVFISLPRSGHDDFFGFGYELKRDKKNKKWDVMAIKQRGGAALTGVTAMCTVHTALFICQNWDWIQDKLLKKYAT